MVTVVQRGSYQLMQLGNFTSSRARRASVLEAERRLHSADLDHVPGSKLTLAVDRLAVDLELHLVFRRNEVFVFALADEGG